MISRGCCRSGLDPRKSMPVNVLNIEYGLLHQSSMKMGSLIVLLVFKIFLNLVILCIARGRGQCSHFVKLSLSG